MKPKVLFLLPNYNLYGGTPKKTLDLMECYGKKSVLYVYGNEYSEFKKQFKETEGSVYEGNFGRNIIKHIRSLLEVIDDHGVNIIQTQFMMGELLGFLIKLFRPKTKLILTFVGSVNVDYKKRYLSSIIYRLADQFVYISKYVEAEKNQEFSILKDKPGVVIYNGTKKLQCKEKKVLTESNSLLAIAGLIELKNIQVLIDALDLLVNKRQVESIHLKVAGDGNYRSVLNNMIEEKKLGKYISLLGYQSNIGQLLNDCDIFVHPCYAEGFGIAVAEAMHAEKPVIISNAGALPELIEHEESGLIVDPYDAEEWADAILRLLNNQSLSIKLASGAKKRAEEMFSVERFCEDYYRLYQELINKK